MNVFKHEPHFHGHTEPIRGFRSNSRKANLVGVEFSDMAEQNNTPV